MEMMAGCGEIDRSMNTLPADRKGNESCSAAATPSLPVPECAICLQTCVHPVSLPCKHVFCYLCVKGASWLGKRCALCRQEIPEDFLDKPTLLSPEELKAAGRGHGEHAWYYEGRNGWWQYDERTSRELEDAFSKGKKSTEMLIAGFLYVADLENMVQYRRNEHGRRRKIKRDIMDIPKKGVAGLRLDCESNSVSLARESSADGADSTPAQGGAPPPPLAASPAPFRPPPALAGPPTSPATPSPDAGTGLEDSLAHLQLSGDGLAGRGQRGEGEEDHEAPLPARPPAAAAEETESDGDGGAAAPAQHRSSGRQRLLIPTGNQAAERPTSGGGSRRPDGQCTVTEV
ncbi:E3 ubiquitin-protein ligase RNF146 isoform X2 [Tachyglossus aculeatus]|uniref:E3 ubiquitin-protein ligase RNF146 isoform X2 n=1 Tax=Tachyglossus aculeatus TaxID=9261 RepID=UPI0018F45AB1|nr:E3 ubiquitin-protein ligase RNF146 isoform X2 [Tachyglossus aculeatus]